MENSIMTLRPYPYAGGWVFDDEATGLVREAFVAGMDDMMDMVTEDFEDVSEGFLLKFGAEKFPGADYRLEWRSTEMGGNWYYCEELETEGWLCPALFKYFESAPKEIFFQATEIKK